MNALPGELVEAGPRRPLALVSLVATLGAASLAAVFGGNGDISIAVMPLALALVALAAWRLPLRDTLPVLAFLCLTLENPAEAWAAGQWRSPLHTVGALFLSKMNLTIPVRALIFTGLDVALALLATVAVFRTRGRERDHPDYVPAARPVRDAALVCIATILVVWAFGMARGGHFGNSLWQVFRVIYLPCVLLLFLAGLRGPVDARRLGTLLIVAAVLRATIAIYVRQLFPDEEAVPFTTIHADSMLFVDAFVLALAILFERPGVKALLLAIVTLPLLTWGMIANNRRLVWVELGACLLFAFVIARWTRLKRIAVQAIVVSLPLAFVYVGVGWSRPTGIFGAVRTLRSVVDSRSDASTAWRDLENFNICYTLRRNPLLGTGFGHEYEEVVLLPDISANYPLYRYAPHNSVIGLLAYAGLLGFAGLWMMIPLGIFFAVRVYRFATTPRDRIVALTSASVLISYVVHCYGDMGLGTWASVFTVAPAIALVAKTAVANGAWPMRTAAARATAPTLDA